MEQVYKFNLDNYIQYYDYDLCDEHSDDEYSDNEADNIMDGASKDQTSETDNPFGTGSSDLSIKEKAMSSGSQSNPSQKSHKLPKSIKMCLDGFSEKMAKTKSFHTKIPVQKLIPSQRSEGTKSICWTDVPYPCCGTSTHIEKVFNISL